MRIGIDARELCGRPTGVGRYLAEPAARVESAARRAPARVRALRAGRRCRQPARPRGGVAPRARRPVVRGGGGTWWEQVRLAAALRRDRPDVLLRARPTPRRSRIGVPLVADDPRRVVRRASRVVPAARGLRRRAADHARPRGARGRVLTDLGVLAGEIVALPRRRRRAHVASFRRASRRPVVADPRGRGRAREPLVLFVGFDLQPPARAGR